VLIFPKYLTPSTKGQSAAKTHSPPDFKNLPGLHSRQLVLVPKHVKQSSAQATHENSPAVSYTIRPVGHSETHVTEAGSVYTYFLKFPLKAQAASSPHEVIVLEHTLHLSPEVQ
ncbi:MAG: hypothetical protein QF535_23315, partial [Anaerolineales bacterium]|nr:hypothetical protein [Anaerolineales bacterium]